VMLVCFLILSTMLLVGWYRGNMMITLPISYYAVILITSILGTFTITFKRMYDLKLSTLFEKDGE